MRTLLLLISYCFALSTAFGQQLTLSHPLEGAVYQRDETGWGTISIGGTFNSQQFKSNISGAYVRARLIQLNVEDGSIKQGGASYTIPIQRVNVGTSYAGSVRVPGGWYRIEVEAVRRYRDPDPYIPPTFIEEVLQTVYGKVGVGEVFIIGGQSNAQGLPNSPGDLNIAQATVSYDGVRTQPVNVGPNANLPRTFYDAVSAQSYSQIKADYVQNTIQSAQTPINQGIAPAGNSIWYWAYLGQRLVQYYQVPIAFYNVAFGGTQIKAWSQSTDNISRPDGFPFDDGRENKYQPGEPYRILRAALRLYGSIYGVRSVLWLQGETDAKALNEIARWGNRAVSSTDDYKNQLQQVIVQTRVDFGPVPWVVGVTSIIGGVAKDSPISLLIAGGQNQAVSLAGNNGALQVYDASGSYVGPQVFLGPDMNNRVTVRRSPGVFPDFGDEPVHFRRLGSDGVDGLNEAGDAWFDALKGILDSQAGDRIRPVPQARIGTEFRTLSINENEGTISAAPGFQQVMWVADNNGTFDLANPVCYGQSVACSGSGRLRAVMTDFRGNQIISQAINLPYSLVNDTPSTPQPPTGGGGGQTCKAGNENSGGNRIPSGAIVGGFGNGSEYMEYQFTNVPSASNYTLTIRYASGDSQAGIDVVVNGTPYQLRPNGTASWTPSATASLTINLNAGTNTVRIQGSGQGNFCYDQLCINSGGGGGNPPAGSCNFAVNPTVSNANPACNGSITLYANCSGGDCGSATFTWTGSNGTSYSGATPSFNAPGTNGGVTYTLTASKAGCTNQSGSMGINVSGCGGGSSSGLVINSASLDCGSGVITLNMTGLNGNPVEYRAPGLQDWSTNQLVIPNWQRSGTSFTFYARQSGNNEASIGYTTGCGSGRLATGVEPGSEDVLRVSPNPTTGKVVVRFTLAEKQAGMLSVVGMSGGAVQSRSVVGTGRMQEETLDLSSQPTGMYVVRLQSGSVQQTAKVLLQR